MISPEGLAGKVRRRSSFSSSVWLTYQLTGVQHAANVTEPLLSPSQRYIHSVITKGNTHLAVTMHPRIIKHIHNVRFLQIDYTFKRVRGEFNEWEVASNLDRYKTSNYSTSLRCLCHFF
jgi:hypothetical protein